VLDVFTLGMVLVSAAALTGMMRKYAINRSLLDLSNPRSSHSIATPRGGGVSIVVTFTAALVFLFCLGRVPSHYFVALLGGGLLVSGIGFWDDHGHISARWRIIIHFAAASWALGWLGSMPPIPVGDVTWSLGWIGDALGVVLLVWFLNLYNFMDGIDGLATVETLCVAGGAAVILLFHGAEETPVWLGLLVASSLGFLMWNWPPAKIFMGDVGSGFLGYSLGVFAIVTASSGELPIWTWFILLGVFLVDATVTLLRRMLSGARWYEAHRSHAYQHAARSWHSHSKVTLSVLGINVLWLLPLASYASQRPDLGLVLTGIAFTPLFLLAVMLRAGKDEDTTHPHRRSRSVTAP
jgi:UDP-N-acetylmuramyl pentapeptide phosphotransferase/UDP-N-acetylglucosamine-1-phosphate transferase